MIIVLSLISFLLNRASAFVIPSNTVVGDISATSFSMITEPSGFETILDSSMVLSGLETSIDFENPGQAVGTIIFLAYVGVSVAAGLKYIFVDGWRPKL